MEEAHTVFDMTYDGQTIDWPGKGRFKATSGLPGYQEPGNTCVQDGGPVPEGKYKVLLADRGIAQDDGTGTCTLTPAWGLQDIPRGAVAGGCEPYWANWGWNRARMEPADAATKTRCSPLMRGGFYLHDSTKGFSHGCIEVESRIFLFLRTHLKQRRGKSLVLKVAYVPGRTTNGGTKA
jgi:hypothetical protein